MSNKTKIESSYISSVLKLNNNVVFNGFSFGYKKNISGEVVFNTGMVGYPETLTDPSYSGQILVLTYPLIGNYGVPQFDTADFLKSKFESDKIHVQGLIVSEISDTFSHWSGKNLLSNWLKDNKIPGIFGVDTRKLTSMLREHGTMLGKIMVDDESIDLYDPDRDDLISKVCPGKIEKLGSGKKKILLLDCGCKLGIIRKLIREDTTVIRQPWNKEISSFDFDAVVLSNGPGNPAVYNDLRKKVEVLLKLRKPVLGICLGHQILSLAAGAKTYKLKYGHRSQNQPVRLNGTNRCFITSQNHGFAVDDTSLSGEWRTWFTNLNDNTNEGIIHNSLPFRSVQFHPEAAPGPTDTSFIFDDFLNEIK
ncbi:MAG: glutamine-hydrolyzing carbamoyl-phosphate synthase small subunit [Melioribacteraceae bacterium]|nr:glutamine-hydrolyzing carbamoyl-phosphate synthase small subunit [Melioribacteraceae bacterium]